MLLVLFLFLSVFLYFPSPLFYCISLLGVVCTLFLWSLYYSIFHTLLTLLILILYIGAIMVLISYVAATSPNFLPNTSPIFNWFYFFILVATTSVFSFVSDQYYYTSSLSGEFSSFFFLSSGSWVFFLLVSFIFIILFISSFLIVQNGTFRSI